MATPGRERARTAAELAEAVRDRTAGYSQKELADLLEIDASAVSRALAGKRAFNLREVALIADWLGVDADELLFKREGALAWRCEAGESEQEHAASLCREALRDYLAFRTVGA